MSFNYIVHPLNGEKLSIFSNSGRELLKSYLRLYKTGGMLSLRRQNLKGLEKIKELEQDLEKTEVGTQEVGSFLRDAVNKDKAERSLFSRFSRVRGGGLLEEQARGFSKEKCNNMDVIEKMLPLNFAGCLAASQLPSWDSKDSSNEIKEPREDTDEEKAFVKNFIMNFIDGKYTNEDNETITIQADKMNLCHLYFKLDSWAHNNSIHLRNIEYKSYKYIRQIKSLWVMIGNIFNPDKYNSLNTKWFNAYDSFRKKVFENLTRDDNLDYNTLTQFLTNLNENMEKINNELIKIKEEQEKEENSEH